MKVGIVDDDLSLAGMLAEELSQRTETTDQPEKVLEWVEDDSVDCLISDLKMPEMSGLELLKKVQSRSPDLPVVMITGHGSVDTAVKAMKAGARDYLEKPVGGEELQVVVDRVESELQKQNQLEGFRASQEARLAEQEIVGDSEEIEALRKMIRKVAPERTNLLIEGETGTGKELIARAAHRLSNRSEAPMMVINCAAIPRELLESELFGHVKGAFTGAKESRKGKVELADGGTLFLDEIGELPLDLQPKLLRVLEQGEVTRVGGDHPRPVDVRVVAATNRNLKDMIARDEFRKDLYYRVNTIKITAPPLRDHPEDIPQLINYFLAETTEQVEFTSEAMAALKSYRWPGNVRELQNLVERLVVLKGDKAIGASDLPPEFSREASDTSQSHRKIIEDWQDYGEDLPEALENLEKNIIVRTLDSTEGNKAEAARELGISRQNLHYKLDKLEL